MGEGKLFLTSKEWEEFHRIVSSSHAEVFAYGSRIKGTHQVFSDIDLLVMTDISDLELWDIREKFDDSNLPMKIDIKRRKDITDAFFSLIKNDLRKVS